MSFKKGLISHKSEKSRNWDVDRRVAIFVAIQLPPIYALTQMEKENSNRK